MLWRIWTAFAVFSLAAGCGEEAVVDSNPDSDLVTFEFQDYEYLQDTYFFLDEVYRSAFPEIPEQAVLVNSQVARVFVNDFDSSTDVADGAEPVVAYALWEAGEPLEDASRVILKGGVEEGSFHELGSNAFDIDSRGYLVMRERVSRGHALAVAYRTVGGDIYGDIGTSGGTRQLKLIKSRNQNPPLEPSDYPTWGLSWRNVYQIGCTGFGPEGFDLEIARESTTQSGTGVSYTEIFGFHSPENFASIPGVNPADGHLVFPYLEPFGRHGPPLLAETDRVPAIYSTTNTLARSEAGRFQIRATLRCVP